MVSGKCGAAWLKLELVPTTRQSRRSQASARQNGTSYFDAPMTHCSSHRRLLQQNLPRADLPQQTASLDHLVGRHEQRGGNVDAERLRSHLLRRIVHSSRQWRRLPGDEFPTLGGLRPSVEEQQFKAARLAANLSFNRCATGDERHIAEDPYLTVATVRRLVLRPA